MDAKHREMYRQAKKNATVRGIPFSLAEHDFERLINAANGRCAVTGIPFETTTGGGRNPWGASLDRIDSSLGYTFANCRIVCTSVNLAMNEWGVDVLSRIAIAMYGDRQASALIPSMEQAVAEAVVRIVTETVTRDLPAILEGKIEEHMKTMMGNVAQHTEQMSQQSINRAPRKIIPQSDGNGGHPIMDLVPLSLASLWRLEKAGKFPPRVQTSEGRVGWFEDEIENWMQSRQRGPLLRPYS
jgi:prophage regulatory protein